MIPPYYAALAIAIIMYLFLPGMVPHPTWNGAQNWWNSQFPALTSSVILSHVLLIHEHSYTWFYRIDGPMWSVAVEWQIYFIFALCLLPLYRKFGIGLTAVLAVLVGIAANTNHLRWTLGANSWFVGDFAFGMVAATFGHSPQHAAQNQKVRYSAVGWCAIILAFAIILFPNAGQPLIIGRLMFHLKSKPWISQLIFGFAVACLIASGNRTLSNSQTSVPLAILSSRVVVLLGSFSYSLYLVHVLILDCIILVTAHSKLPPLVYEFVAFVLAPVISLVCAYLFYLTFERPFLNTRPPSGLSEKVMKIAPATTSHGRQFERP